MIRVRPAVPNDALPLAVAQVAAWKDTYRGPVSPAFLDQLTGEQWAPRHRGRIEVARDPRSYLVAELQGAVRGFASFGTARAPEPSTSGEIYAIYVHPEAIGQGLGSALFDAAKSALHHRGFTVVMLWVMVGNDRAITFYERKGMTHDGTTKHDVMPGIGEWDDLRYAL